jgi:NADH-quinone oxidoreductase subunit C
VAGRTAEDIAGELKRELGAKVTDLRTPSAKRIYMGVAPADWPETAMHLWGKRRARFNIATGLELRDCFEVLYHFSLNEGDESGEGAGDGVICSVRVRTEGRDDPTLPSVADRIKALNFIERELHDLLGIRFDGHPDLAPLLTSEDWPEDFYPLRRTEERAELDRGTLERDMLERGGEDA